MAGVDAANRIRVDHPHNQGAGERAQRLGSDIGQDFSGREPFEGRQGHRHRRVEVSAAESAGDEDRQAHPQTPPPGDGVVVTGGTGHGAQFLAARDNLCHHTHPEQNQNHRSEELCGALA